MGRPGFSRLFDERPRVLLTAVGFERINHGALSGADVSTNKNIHRFYTLGEKIDIQGRTDDLATLPESPVGYLKNHPPIPRGELLDRRPLTATPNKKSAEESAEGSEQAPSRLTPAGNRNYYGVPAEPETEPAKDESPLPWEDDPDAPSVPKDWWDDD